MFANKALLLEPMVSTSPSETHAALVVSQTSYTDVVFEADFTTISQLRIGSPPNPWECAWAVFNYTDNTHFYYVALKPNGWELGKADPAYPGGQRFLATSEDMTFAVGSRHSFQITQTGDTITVAADGKILTTFTDKERPYLTGKVGFYTEDAKVAFDTVTGSISESFEPYPIQTFSDGARLSSAWETPFVGYGLAEIFDFSSAEPSTQIVFTGTRAADYISANELDNTIYGKEGGDNLNGQAGRDLVFGGMGADAMSGGYGRDTFAFSTVSEASGDRIVDWYADILNLAGIDANTSTGGNNTFTFVGTHGFSGRGQLHYAQDSTKGLTYIEGNVSGGLAPEFRIEVVGLHAFLAADFIL
jgi:Ca2+-binding RTX toxin-like protein